MVDKGQIDKWLKEGTINKEQAEKMLADSSKDNSEERTKNFIGIVSIIGAVLIFIGIAWLIASNWHYIPNLLKVIILVSATLGIFVLGVYLRQEDHEAIGRSLLALGALLYILSLFLISQTYHLATDMQHYAWLLLLAWPVILIIAYFLDSKENLLISMLTFFPWAILQYFSSITSETEQTVVFGLILIFLGAGALLFGISAFHKSIRHKFTNVYRFWTTFYFLLIFYVLSFQSFLPLVGNYSFEGAFSFFLFSFVAVCVFGFLIGTFFSLNKKSISIKEVAGFIGIIFFLFILIFFIHLGAASMGICSAKSCHDFETQSECNSAPAELRCVSGRCESVDCYEVNIESECNSKSGCAWRDDYNNCRRVFCPYFETQSQCNSVSDCNWNTTLASCHERGSCHNLRNASECNSEEVCSWSFYGGCELKNCHDFETQSECSSLDKCSWDTSYCTDTLDYIQRKNLYECSEFNNQRESCLDNEICSWRPSTSLSGGLNTSLWFLWILINFIFIGFIILVIWYGQKTGSTHIVNLGLVAFILEIITRYIGFWMDFEGYFAFSVLAILGGIILIGGAWLFPKIRRKILNRTKKHSNPEEN